MATRPDGAESPFPDLPVELVRLAPVEEKGLRLQTLMFAVVGVALLLWVGTLIGIWVIGAGVVGVVALAIALGVVFIRRGESHRESLLWALAIAAERGVPLAPAALAFADQFGRGYRWRARLLAYLLDEGKTLPEALDEVPGLLNKDSRLLIRTGWESGTLSRALRDAAAAKVEGAAVWGAVASRLLYLGWVLVFAESMIAFTLYYIAPKFEAIFRDFGIALPGPTVWTIRASHVFVDGYGGLGFVLFTVLELAVLLGIPLGLLNVLQWDIPIVDLVFRRKHTALLLRTLSLSVEGGRPIPEALETLSESHPSGFFRRRLRRTQADVVAGRDWVESLKLYALIRPADAAVISSAQRAGNLAWALQETAVSAERRLGYRINVLVQLTFPMVVIALGGLVFVYALAFFLPVVRLIERLAG